MSIDLSSEEAFWLLRALEHYANRDDYWGIEAVASARKKLREAYPPPPVTFKSFKFRVDELMPKDCFDIEHRGGRRERFKL